jgi:hypothetical protein
LKTNQKNMYRFDVLIQRASKVVKNTNTPVQINCSQKSLDNWKRKGPIFTCAVYIY